MDELPYLGGKLTLKSRDSYISRVSLTPPFLAPHQSPPYIVVSWDR